MPTLLEIVDTAVKVGLGALISGITTYLVTVRAQQHDVRKSMQNEKKDLLREATAKLERASSLLNETRQSVHHLLVAGGADQEGGLHESLANFTTAYNLAKEARSLCFLIGEKELADLVSDYCNLIEGVRMHYVEQGLGYDLGFVDANTDQLSTQKNIILHSLADAFDRIYR